MKVALIIIIIIALLLGGAAYYFFDAHKKSSAAIKALEDAKEELAFEAEKLKQEKAEITKELEAKISDLSKEKEQELLLLKSTYDTLVADMKNEIEQGQIKITKLADRLSVSMVDKILFPSGQADIMPSGLKVLERVGNVLKNTKDKIIRVEGHTDNVPISSKLEKQFLTNWELSTARATNVVRFLQDQVGIDPKRLQAVGMSEFHPVASNETAAGRSQNRRIEILLLPEISEKTP